jgi:hypothetical protein
VSRVKAAFGFHPKVCRSVPGFLMPGRAGFFNGFRKLRQQNGHILKPLTKPAIFFRDLLKLLRHCDRVSFSVHFCRDINVCTHLGEVKYSQDNALVTPKA